MLQSLHIENIAVIRDAEVEFDRGFTVLTGETGAGKSMIIDGINLLLGSRASREIIRTGAQRAAVTAMFCGLDRRTQEALAALEVYPDEDGALFLSRIVSADAGEGVRSQSRINGHNVPSALGREVGRLLLDIHGQNDNQKLLDDAAHGAFLDAYAGDAPLLTEYTALFEKMAATAARIKELHKNEGEREYRLARAKEEVAEIDAAKLHEGEEETLDALRTKLINLEKIKKQTTLVYRALSQSDKGVTASYLIDRASGALSALDGMMPQAAELAKKLEDMKYELEDIAERTHDYVADYDGDPTAELNRTEARLDLIGRLKRKYGGGIGEILEFRRKNAEVIDMLENSDGTVAALMAQYTQERAAALAAAQKLTAARTAAGERIEREILGTLQYLDMPNVRFSAGITPRLHEDGQPRLGRTGGDEVAFLISTNPGEPLMPLSKIASGGELARIMLALKSVLTDRAGTGTVVYDEIDTGISGRTSQKIGGKLKQISQSTQVICVTHSAQIASVADRHCLIRKGERDGRAETEVTTLDDEGRTHELARIIGGLDLTEKTLDAARELLAAGRTLS